jgi:hypothetical protein
MMFFRDSIDNHVAYLHRENNKKIEQRLRQVYYSNSPISETKDADGNLHSFGKKPALIESNSITGDITYKWFNHGNLKRNNNPASIDKCKNKNLTTVRTWDADIKPHSFNDRPYIVKKLKILGIFTCFSIKIWAQKGDIVRENGKAPIIARYLFGKSIHVQMLYNTPILESDLKRVIKHSKETKAPVWASWFLIMKAITKEQFDMFAANGIWDTEVPVKWILYAWKPEGIFLTGRTITANDGYTSGEHDSGHFMQQTSITTKRLLYNLAK